MKSGYVQVMAVTLRSFIILVMVWLVVDFLQNK